MKTAFVFWIACAVVLFSGQLGIDRNEPVIPVVASGYEKVTRVSLGSDRVILMYNKHGECVGSLDLSSTSNPQFAER